MLPRTPRPSLAILPLCALAAFSLGSVSCSAKDAILDHLNAVDFEMHLEKFDTTAGTFSDLPPPTNKRVAEAVASKGKLYFIGGIKGSTQYVDFVEIYDPATKKWSTGAAWPNPRLAQAFEIDGLICMVAGIKDIHEVADVECYHTDTNVWTKRKPFPTGAAQLNVVLSGGKIYALGSVTGSITDRTAHVESYVYDPGADTWTSIAPLPAACSPKGVAAVDDSAYILGCPQGEGGDPTRGPATRVYRYSLSANVWSIYGDPIPGEDWSATLVIDKEILMYALQGNPTIYRLHHLTKTFQTASPPPTPFNINAATLSWTTKGDYYTLVHSELKSDGAGDGGKGTVVVTGHVWKYSLATDTWTHAGEHRQDPRATSLSPVVIGDDAYLVGSYATAQLTIH